ncbi:hypothetical protein LTR04_005008 [Oleoguttula sp. CCFEE 6159]|nr:hypothetical protein LTR04_005008 [Oleoguttula sp. CCFEE 6159]
MLTRTFKRSILEGLWASPLPPTSLLPLRASITTVSHTTSASAIPEALTNSATQPSDSQTASPRVPQQPDVSSHQPISQSPLESIPKLPTPTSHDPSIPTTPLSDSIRELLPLLRAQSPHYITAHIHARPYLVTQGDTLRLPFLMRDVSPGDVLRLNRASLLGSRDYTLRAAAPAPVAMPVHHSPLRAKGGALPNLAERGGYLDERLFVCRAVVMGTEAEPMRVMEKTKRRQRHVKTVRSKLRFTVLRIKEVRVRSLEEIESGEEE